MGSSALSSSLALAWAKGHLEAAGAASPMAEARTLLAHCLHVELGQLALIDQVDPVAAAHFSELVEARAAGTPVQHLTGRAWFRTVELQVGPGVFSPRPETEVMTGWALDQLTALESPLVVELCAGSGAIAKAIAAEHPGARVHTVELDPVAAEYARRNLSGTGVELREGDMAQAFTDLDGTVDLVISNPPYIPLSAWESVEPQVRDYDPHLALFSGQDGLDAMRVVARVAARLLKAGGVVCAEHAEVQAHSAPAVFVDHGGFQRVRDLPDLNGRPRFVTAQRTHVPVPGVAGCAG